MREITERDLQLPHLSFLIKKIGVEHYKFRERIIKHNISLK